MTLLFGALLIFLGAVRLGRLWMGERKYESKHVWGWVVMIVVGSFMIGFDVLAL